MPYLFFSSPTKETIAPEIIKTLVMIRKSDYNPVKINALLAPELLLIKKTAEILGTKILTARLSPSAPYAHFLREKSSFFNTIGHFIQNEQSTFPLVAYTAQLLQYYTIISDPQFFAGTTLLDFEQFLNDNLAKFGKTDKNLFLTEYKLIKIYNDLATLTDTAPNFIATTKPNDETVDFLKTQLRIIQTQVNQWSIDAPDNVFVVYLQFVMHYTYAKMNELEFRQDQSHLENPASSDSLKRVDIQEIHLKNAETSLKELKNLMADTSTYTKGLEFSFGQNVLNFLPVKELNNVASHVSELLHSSP